MRHTLRKSEIVSRKQNFHKIFSEGKRFESSFLKCYVLSQPANQQGANVRVGFALPRGIKRAVDRNRLKRLMRESYRLNKEIIVRGFYSTSSSVCLIFLYSPKEGKLHPLPSAASMMIDMKHLMNSITRTRLS